MLFSSALNVTLLDLLSSSPPKWECGQLRRQSASQVMGLGACPNN